MSDNIFHPDFSPTPYWWEFFKPRNDLIDDLPARSDVVIVGGGYTGLSAALALSAHGVEATVLEANAFGFGASTRNGGGVGGAINVGKSLSGRRLKFAEGEREAILSEASQALAFIENRSLKPGFECDWDLNGRFIGAWTPRHYRAQAASVASLNEHAAIGASMVPREEQKAQLNTDLYHGGMYVARSATVNPAKLYKGLLENVLQTKVRLCAETKVEGLRRTDGQWTVNTNRGPVKADQVIVATNGYTGPAIQRLQERIIPVFSNIIVTEELPAGLAEHIFPTGRYVNDSPRIRSYFRLTSDGKRVLFGGRGRFRTGTYEQYAESLYRMMLDRMPDLRGIKVSHAWSGRIAFTFDSLPHVGERDGQHFALGCNGSGVAMMNYLGDYIGRKVAGQNPYRSQFERHLPGNPFYKGKPWFLPVVGQYFQARDKLDRLLQ
jgi:glycine/D-amino acid oxidase-like deaminating enzyme